MSSTWLNSNIILRLDAIALNDDDDNSRNIIGTGRSESLFGTPNDDVIVGLVGNDALIGLTGDDDLYGGLGNDFLNGLFGDDDLYGGAGNDVLVGLVGGDDLNGGVGNDFLDGGVGNDNLIGGFGNDIIVGNVGNDDLIGGPGNDVLVGGPGNDELLGGTGRDTLIGGIGRDEFVFFGASGGDRILNFVPIQDEIELNRAIFGLGSALGRGFSVKGEFAIVNTNVAAANSVAKIVYNQGNGALFYNANQNVAGFGQTGELLAIFAGAPSLNRGEFEIISDI